MDRNADMNAALAFVINRIEDQAMRSGQPLDEEQRSLLNNLPKESDIPEFSTGDPEFSVEFRLRDVPYEKLCALAKDAYRSDRERNPGSLEWEFAFNVSKLNAHPLHWLLQWAGVKQRRPWSDRWLLLAASLFFVIVTIPLMLIVVDQEWVLWRLGNCRCRVHCSRALPALCFPENRTTPARAKHRGVQAQFSRPWRSSVVEVRQYTYGPLRVHSDLRTFE